MSDIGGQSTQIAAVNVPLQGLPVVTQIMAGPSGVLNARLQESILAGLHLHDELHTAAALLCDRLHLHLTDGADQKMVNQKHTDHEQNAGCQGEHINICDGIGKDKYSDAVKQRKHPDRVPDIRGMQSKHDIGCLV